MREWFRAVGYTLISAFVATVINMLVFVFVLSPFVTPTPFSVFNVAMGAIWGAAFVGFLVLLYAAK